MIRVNQGHTEECPVVEIGKPSKRTVGGGGLERDRDRQPIIETAGVEEADKRTREKPGRRKRRTERRKEDSKDGWK